MQWVFGCWMLAAMVLAGCATRPGADMLAPVPAVATAVHHVNILVATPRERDPENSQSFSSNRASTLNFARYTISIPPNHQTAAIEWPKTLPPDPETSFATIGFEHLGQKAFGDQVAVGGEDKRKVVVFVHGYNTNFAEGLYRMAQIVADNPMPVSAVLFSWPSDGTTIGYVADKEAVAYSRDHLVRLLAQLADDPRIGEINLFAHSMGCWLTAETLRQLRLSGQDRVIRRLASVALAAPDIDLDVFRNQLETIGTLEPPLTILVSTDDRALHLSRRLGGERVRVGILDVNDPRVQSLAEAYHLQIIDISQMSGSDGLNHDRYLGSAKTLLEVLGGGRKENPARRAGAFVLDAAASVLELPGKLGRAAARGLAD